MTTEAQPITEAEAEALLARVVREKAATEARLSKTRTELGEPLYKPERQAQAEANARAPFEAALSATLARARAVEDAATDELRKLDDMPIAPLLDTDTLQRAAAMRPFAEDEAERLDAKRLAARLAALDGSDKAAVLAWRTAAEKRLAVMMGDLAENPAHVSLRLAINDLKSAIANLRLPEERELDARRRKLTDQKLLARQLRLQAEALSPEKQKEILQRYGV